MTLSIEQLETRRLLAVTVLPDRIETPTDTIPRFVSTPSIQAVQSGDWADPSTWGVDTPDSEDLVSIPAGVSVQLTGDAAAKAIEIGGSLSFAAEFDTSLMVETITVLPGGVLSVGDRDNPITATAEIVFADTPIDWVNDPYQFSHGLIVFGEFETAGERKTSFVRAAADINHGDTVIELQSVPADWQIGDEILLPETSQTPIDRRFSEIDQTETAIIESIEGNTVTLTLPAMFDHHGISENPFGVEVYPHIANLTRNIVFQSANPEGTRGHTMIAGDGVAYIQDAKFLSLGRTSADSVADDAHEVDGVIEPASNQIARYPVHLHHSASRSTIAGSVVQDNRKWGIAIHGDVDDTLLLDNIVYDTDGSGIVTEAGLEQRTVFENNLIVKVDGGWQKDDTRAGVTNLGSMIEIAADGSGFWMRAAAGTFMGNAVYDAAGWAYNFNGYYHNFRTPGFELQTWDRFRGNEAVSSHGGFWDTWSQGMQQIDQYQRQTVEDLLIWHSETGVETFHTANLDFRDITIIGDPAVSSQNVGSDSPGRFETRISEGFDFGNKSYQNFDHTLDGIKVSGMNVGIVAPIHAGDGSTLANAQLANYVDIAYIDSTPIENLTVDSIEYLSNDVGRVSATQPETRMNRWSESLGEIIDNPPINNPPTIAPMESPIVVNTLVRSRRVSVGGLSSGDEGQSFSLLVGTESTEFFEELRVIHDPGSDTATVVFEIADGQIGEAVVTVSVDDGELITSESFTVIASEPDWRVEVLALQERVRRLEELVDRLLEVG